MKKWLKQKTTITGIIFLIMTGLQAYQSGGDVITAVLAVLSAALLYIKDGKFLSGLCFVALVGQVSTSCASVPIPKDEQVKTAVVIGCNFMEQAGCFEDAAIQAAFPNISLKTCPDTIEYLSEAAEIVISGGSPEQKALAVLDKIDLKMFDPSKLSGLKNASCAKAANALGVK
jgi:hypothetical protein